MVALDGGQKWSLQVVIGCEKERWPMRHGLPAEVLVATYRRDMEPGAFLFCSFIQNRLIISIQALHWSVQEVHLAIPNKISTNGDAREKLSQKFEYFSI